jgi:hypothetical protein
MDIDGPNILPTGAAAAGTFTTTTGTANREVIQDAQTGAGTGTYT